MPRRRKISAQRFDEMLRDIQVPDEEIAKYLTGDPAASRAFGPAITPDPARVELTPEQLLSVRGTTGMKLLNSFARWRRKQRFEAAAGDDPRPVVLAEGDSWFQFPFLLDDVVDHLEDSFRVRCYSEAGDVLANMVFAARPEYLDGLAELASEPGLRALIFSGAGNDFLGEDPDAPRDDPLEGSILARLVRDHAPGQSAAWHIDTPEFRLRFDAVAAGYRRLLGEVQRIRPGLRVVVHGYDYAFPSGVPGDPRGSVVWAARDQWLAGPLRRLRGIGDPALQQGIVVELVDRLNGLLASLCGGNRGSGEFPFAFHADLRGTLTSPADYADELHPTNEGYARVAAKIARWI